MESDDGLTARRRGVTGSGDGVLRRILTDPAPQASLPVSSTALLGLLLLAPFGLALVLEGATQERLDGAAHMVLLLQNVAVLVAATVLRYEWEMSRTPSTGWLAVVLGFLAVQNLPFTLLLVAGSPLGELGAVYGVVTTVTAALSVLFLWLGRRGVAVPRDNPLIIAASLGLTMAALRMAAAHTGLDPTLDLSASALLGLDLAAALAGCWAMVELIGSEDLPPWFRRYAIVAAALLTLSAAPLVAEGELAWLAAPVMGALGVLLLIGGATGLLRATLRAQTRQLVDLTRQAARAETSARHGRERAHELSATITGIAHASRLLLLDHGLAASERRRLRGLIDEEMARLDRMLTARAERGEHVPETVHLDAVVEPVVAVQRTLGHHVTYRSTGVAVWGDFDELAEVLHILLTNAARHAPGAMVTIAVEPIGERVVLRVRDDGPGLAPDVADRLFRWGARRHDSPGEGIGLHLARRLVRAQGGELRLDAIAGGTSFLVELPAAPVSLPSGTEAQETDGPA